MEYTPVDQELAASSGREQSSGRDVVELDTVGSLRLAIDGALAVSFSDRCESCRLRDR